MAVNVASGTVHGTVDATGRLIAADQRLLRLQRQAGGEEGGVLAIPQLAVLARLSQSLGVQVSRTVVVADGAIDVDLTVLAKPQNGLIELAVEGWRERPASRVSPIVRNERARYFAEVENDGGWACDSKLRLVHISQSLTGLVGQVSENGIGVPVLHIFRLIEDDVGELPLLTALAGREPFAGQLAELRSDPSVGLWLSGAARLDPAGQFMGYEGTLSFVDRHHAISVGRPPSDECNDSEPPFSQSLEAALREPITRIIANADEISARSNGAIRQNYAGYASDISAAGRHLLGLIDDISDMQAIEQQDFSAGDEIVDLADVARRAAGLLKVRAADQGVRIDAPALDEVIEARGDFRRVLQIIVNLLSNALRYSPHGSNVWIRSEVEGDLAAVVVADQGKGIAQDDQARIFEKFERVDASEPGGTGLGLYISRRLARAMGGDITVDSAPGQGSRFILTLPLADASND